MHHSPLNFSFSVKHSHKMKNGLAAVALKKEVASPLVKALERPQKMAELSKAF